MVDVPGLVILVLVVVLLFVAVPAWFIWALRNWVWPEGNRVEGWHNGIRCTLIFSDEAREEMGLDEGSAQRLADDCARATWCTREAWVDMGVDPTFDPTPRLSHTVARFVTDREFDGDRPMPWAAAVLLKVGKRVGGAYLPMTVSRTKYRDRQHESGEPVIHEMCHQLVWESKNDGIALYDYMHADERVWVAAGGEDTVQGVARKMYEGS